MMRFGLLGPLTVHDGSEELTPSNPLGRLLLVALLLNPNRPVSTDRLQAVLWGERPPQTAAASLHNHVLRLRRTLGPAGRDRLRSAPSGFLLLVEDGELDTEVFSAHVQRARSAHTRQDWPEAGREAAAALALWRGEPLADLPGLADSPEAAHLTELRLQALEWHGEAEIEAGRHHGLVADLARLAAEHPMREAFHRQLMIALHRGGRAPEALAVYRSLRATLVDHLGVEPSASVQQLHHEILAADAQPSAPPVTPAASPERSAAPSQLPADPSVFAGRQEEITALIRHLGGGGGTVLITGMGGIGKTALAVHAAHRLRPDYPDGHLYADMRGFGSGDARTAEQLLARFLTDLGLAPSAVPADLDDRSARYRAVLADRRVMIILDNVRDTAQIADLLPGPGRSAVIVTSRHRLPSLPNAVHLGLAPLDDTAQRGLLAALCGEERAAGDRESADRILEACGGMPLALRIAGARLASRPAWPLSTLARRLSLTNGRLSALAIDHLSVTGTLSVSYHALKHSRHALERDAARAFRLLGLWPAHPMSPEAAAALLGEPLDRAMDLLDSLVDSHLLETHDGSRYRFHDLLGEFAGDLARREEPEAERDAAVLRLLAWYVHAVTRARDLTVPSAPAITPSPEPSLAPLPLFGDTEEALAWYGSEMPALKEVIRRSGPLRRPDLGWRVARELLGYSQGHLQSGEWEQCLASALEMATEHGDLQGQAWMNNCLGVSHGLAHRGEESLRHLREAARLFELTGETEALASNVANQSMAHQLLGQVDLGLAALDKADRLRAKAGLGAPLFTVSARADLLLTAGRTAEAEAVYRQALEGWRERDLPTNVATTLTNLGDTLRQLGRREEAFAAFEESMAIRRALGIHVGVADTLEAMARAYFDFGEFPWAEECWRQALAIGEEEGMEWIIGDCRKGLAMLGVG
ncbi:DNA-binding SARP family transcriptional activator [Streptomyces sp. TLI_235]|nr:DNA-binding SARP family transcriptional activator [Streptomyces sp. TLI_235]